MKVYVAMIADRHADVEAHVFTSDRAAIAYAKQCVAAYARHPESVEEQEVAGWLYYASYSPEGDAVWVVEREVDKELKATPH